MAKTTKGIGNASFSDATLRSAQDSVQDSREEYREPSPEDTVLLKLTRDRNEGRGLYVNVNDRNWFIPRGVTVTVPRYIAEVVERSILQDERTQLLIDELSARGDRF